MFWYGQLMKKQGKSDTTYSVCDTLFKQPRQTSYKLECRFIAGDHVSTRGYIPTQSSFRGNLIIGIMRWHLSARKDGLVSMWSAFSSMLQYVGALKMICCWKPSVPKQIFYAL